MIRILIFGLSISFLLFSSCYSVKNIKKKGRFLEDYYHYYINDSLKFSYKLPSDYDVFTKKAIIKNSLQQNHLPLKPNFCLVYRKTNINPDLEHYVFYYKDSKTANKEIGKIIKNESVVCYPEPFIDTLNHVLIKGAPSLHDKGFIYIVAKSKEREFSSLKNEYLNFIFNNIKTGNEYNELALSDPFRLADSNSLNKDSTVNYLLPISVLKEKESNYVTINDRLVFLQALATYQSFISNQNDILEKYISEWRSSHRYLGDTLSLYSFCAVNDNAIEYILNECNDKKIVMFNENHFSPNNRLLLSLLLKSLYEKSFRYFGFEAIYDEKNTINKKGFVAFGNGFYTNEPMLSNLIHEAISIGYQVFGYDYYTEKNNREKEQALNIYNSTLKKDSLSKVIILAGFEHISKSPIKNKMAMEFKQLAGIEPFVIDQIEYKDKTNNWLSVIDTTLVQNKKRVKADMYLSNKINYEIIAKKDSYHNYTIVIPDTIYNYIKLNLNEELILSIYRTDEYLIDKTVTPVYNYVFSQSIANISIMLPKNKYFFIIRNNNNINNIIYHNKL